MKVLLVSFCFPPFNAIGAVRAGKLAKQLIAAGHEVRVLTAEHQLLPRTLPLEIPASLVTRTASWGINGVPMAVFGRRRQRYRGGEAVPSGAFTKIVNLYRSLFNVCDGQIGWYRQAVRASRRLAAEWAPDVIYASAPPFTGLMVAQRLSRATGIPWVGELRDLWTDNYHPDWPAWRRAIEAGLESRVLSSAMGLVTVSDPLAERLRAKYTCPVAVVPNGFDPDDYPRDGARANGDELRIIYTGSVYSGRQDPAPLFAAVRSLGADRQRIKIEFYGRNLPGVRRLAEGFGIEDQVSIHAEVPFRESARLQAGADILLLLQWNSAAEPGVFMGKLFEYLGARRPVLAVGLPAGVASDLIHERQAGFVSNSVDELAARLSQWLAVKSEAGAIPDLPASAASGLSSAEQFASLYVLLEKWRTKAVEVHRRRRVAVLVPRLAIGGTEQHLVEVLPKIDKHRFAITVVTTRGPGPLDDKLRHEGIPVVYAAARKGPLSIAGSFFGVAGFLRRAHPDIVHFFLPEAYIIGGLCAVLLGQRNRIMSRRSLNRYHSRRWFSATVERWLHARMDKVLANSKAVAGELLAEGVAAGHLCTIYSGIDVNRYATLDRSVARRKLDIPDGTLAFVCVANLISYKGHRDLLDAFAVAAPDLPKEWQLLAVGRDEGIGSDLRDHAAKLGISANVRWTGERDDVRDFLAASDIAVLASHEEGLPKSILEAMAAGLPSVVTRVGGTPEAVDNHVTGIVVEARDTAAMARALIQLANDAEIRVQLGRAAQRRVNELFRMEKCVAQYERIYDVLLERPVAVSPNDMPESLTETKSNRSA